MSEYLSLTQVDIDVGGFESDGVRELRHLLKSRLPGFGEIYSHKRAYSGRRSGVYFLWRGNELRYIGKTTHIQSRLASHEGHGFPCNEWDSYSFLECPADVMSSIEDFYIRELQPPDNTQGKF